MYDIISTIYCFYIKNQLQKFVVCSSPQLTRKQKSYEKSRDRATKPPQQSSLRKWKFKHLPLAAIRSAPTTTASTRPNDFKEAAAESATSTAGILSCTNSNAVNLDPCSNPNLPDKWRTQLNTDICRSCSASVEVYLTTGTLNTLILKPKDKDTQE
jgi:hypothetical protein